MLYHSGDFDWLDFFSHYLCDDLFQFTHKHLILVIQIIFILQDLIMFKKILETIIIQCFLNFMQGLLIVLIFENIVKIFQNCVLVFLKIV